MELSGKPLSLEKIADVAYSGESVQIADSARARILASRKVVDDIIARDAVVYGVNTGFGKLADVRIPHAEIGVLQLNLVRSHACGIGPTLSEPEVRAMMLLRANVLTIGFSGVSTEVLALLNGTQSMHAVCGLSISRAKRLASIADVAGAMTLEGLRDTPAAFDPRLHDARPHQGQKTVAAHLNSLLQDSEIRESHRK